MELPGQRQLITKLHTLRTLTAAGLVRPTRPDRLVGSAWALARFGATPAAGYAASALRFPDATAIIDDAGTLTFKQVHERSNAIAHGLREDGVREGDGVGIMARNHRGWVESVVACSKLGADALFLNTSFSAPQLADVTRREDPAALIYDDEFADVLEEAGAGRRRYATRSHDPGNTDRSLEDLARARPISDLAPPRRHGKAIILTSGTTGTPKGASRGQPKSLDPAAALLARIPLKARGRTMIAAPLFHAWGFAHFTLGLALSSTLVLKRRFDPEGILSLTARHECSALVAVPVMLQRILELPEASLRAYDVSKLRVVAVSGSALPGAVSDRWMNLFGGNLYNLYGSTEVAWATIATPQDLREAPGTAGRPPFGTVVRIYDEADRPVTEPGATGRIFVGNEMQFDGYTGGGSKDVLDGLMSSGDVGHFDADGRLFIDGRDDDMIVSGGENVFPGEVEDLLHSHPAIAEAAVFGVEDARFGQRLRAVVVLRPGHELDARGVQDHVKRNLAGYKVPRDVDFVSELPRTSTGKVLKRDLRGAPGGS